MKIIIAMQYTETKLILIGEIYCYSCNIRTQISEN